MYGKPIALWLTAVLLGSLAGVLPAVAQGEEMADGTPVTLGTGEQKVLSFADTLAKVATSDPEVAAVSVSGDRELLVTAKSQGAAILSVWLKGRSEPMRSPVVVASTLGARLPFGTQVQTDIRIVEVNRNELNELGMYYSKLFDSGRLGARKRQCHIAAVYCTEDQFRCRIDIQRSRCHSPSVRFHSPFIRPR